ncbi:MAG: hypothetical protein SVX43_17735 [Cyanobacteriota bacterium]|nr:hypothetical protein [Cyanobacteriota bacterium]
MVIIKLLGVVVMIGYFWGVLKFWKGYQQTNFQPSPLSRLALSLLWPALIAVNKSYRQNFQKALKGR